MNNVKGYLLRIYPISLKGKYLLRGWYLIRNEDGEEWLMRRHYALSSQRFWSLYRVSIPLEKYIYQKESQSNPVAKATFLGIVFAAFVRYFIPLELLIGSINLPFSFIQALINISIVLLVSFISIIVLISFRDFRLKFFIKSKGAEIKKIGKIRSLEPLRITPSGKEFW